ncbi:hypothetical protein ACFY7C_19910 [Streptomyces sp. NPDC012769]|uniref:hypothetical protein n=1 Tax=Streptomyces sp. NPDC012769 TaxID=3364848 RepID=UPI0036BF10D9
MHPPERGRDRPADGEDRLRARLREAAAAHEPDRARMLARVERGVAAHRPARQTREPLGARAARSAPWLRTAGAALAVAAVVAAGVSVVPALTGPTGPAVPAATGSTSASASVPGPLRITATGAIDPGSNRYWAQSEITLTTPAPLTALTVELRVAQTGGVASTGHWRTLPAEDFTVTVREEGGALVYRWTLRPDRPAPAGRHVFAAQYDHAEGPRAAASDTYTVTATDTSGRRATADGGFTPAEGPPP